MENIAKNIILYFRRRFLLLVLIVSIFMWGLIILGIRLIISKL